MDVSPEKFKDLFANWPSGVAVVTCIGQDGEPQGFTASSVVSVSLEPPLVLFALKRTARSLPHFEKAQAFGLNFLRQGQEEISNLFATPGADRFGAVVYEAGAATGVPLLEGAWGQVECQMHAQYDGGDHVLFLGRIVSLHTEDEEPLVYHRRGYRALAKQAETKRAETSAHRAR